MNLSSASPRPRPDLLVQHLGIDERVVLDLESGSFFGVVGLAARLWDELWEDDITPPPGGPKRLDESEQVEVFLHCLDRAGLLSAALPPSSFPPSDLPEKPWLEGDEVSQFMASGRSGREAFLLRHGDIRSLTLGPSAGIGESGNPMVFRSSE